MDLMESKMTVAKKMLLLILLADLIWLKTSVFKKSSLMKENALTGNVMLKRNRHTKTTLFPTSNFKRHIVQISV